ncbi:hypothetical protein CITRIK5_50422 [Citricoccus sp. K5]|nr:hypothetical protein CITRIK5_50422 [Citricoccus sp. K5]
MEPATVAINPLSAFECNYAIPMA